MKRPLRLLCAALLALVVVPSAPATAADNGAWSVTPTPADASSPTPRSYFVLEGNPGATITDKVRIRNYTNRPLTFRLYGADGYNTAEGGFFALRSLERPQEGVGAWLQMPVQTVKVAKRTQVDVPFTLSIPANATPGDHVGGIVALNEAVEGTTESGGVDVGIKRAVAARLYLRVAGPTTPALSVEDVALTHDRGFLPWSGSGKGTVTYTVRNTGNLRLTPESVIKVSGMIGRHVDTVENPGVVDLLPGQVARLRAKVSGIGAVDRLSVTVTASTTEGVTAEDTTTEWILPWPAVLLFLLLLTLATWWLLRRRAEKKRAFAAVGEAPRLTIGAGQ